MDARIKMIADRVEELNDLYYIVTIGDVDTLMYRGDILGVIVTRLTLGKNFNIMRISGNSAGLVAEAGGTVVFPSKHYAIILPELMCYTDIHNSIYLLDCYGKSTKLASDQQYIEHVSKALKRYAYTEKNSIEIMVALKEARLKHQGCSGEAQVINITGLGLDEMNMSCIKTLYIHNRSNKETRLLQFSIGGPGMDEVFTMTYNLDSEEWARGSWNG